MAEDPRASVTAIRTSLTKVRALGLTDIEVTVDWTLYRDLLKLRGLPSEPSERDTWGTDFIRRPITTFDGERLRLAQGAPQVLGRTESGVITGWAIVSTD